MYKDTACFKAFSKYVADTFESTIKEGSPSEADYKVFPATKEVMFYDDTLSQLSAAFYTAWSDSRELYEN